MPRNTVNIYHNLFYWIVERGASEAFPRARSTSKGTGTAVCAVIERVLCASTLRRYRAYVSQVPRVRFAAITPCGTYKTYALYLLSSSEASDEIFDSRDRARQTRITKKQDN